MKDVTFLAMWFFLPFLIGAAFHYFGAWIGIPALLMGGLYWLGLTVLIFEDKK